MPSRYEQLLDERHPDYSPPGDEGGRTNSLLEGFFNKLKKFGDKAKELNKAADDGLYGLATHGQKDDDEEQIEKRWEGLGSHRQDAWNEWAAGDEGPDVDDGMGGTRKMSGWEAFRENEINTRKQYAVPRKPVGYQELPTDSGDFEQHIQTEWDSMEDGDKSLYSDDFTVYLDMRKRAEQTRRNGP